jgi:hypothetical protein
VSVFAPGPHLCTAATICIAVFAGCIQKVPKNPATSVVVHLVLYLAHGAQTPDDDCLSLFSCEQVHMKTIILRRLFTAVFECSGLVVDAGEGGGVFQNDTRGVADQYRTSD